MLKQQQEIAKLREFIQRGMILGADVRQKVDLNTFSDEEVLRRLKTCVKACRRNAGIRRCERS